MSTISSIGSPVSLAAAQLRQRHHGGGEFQNEAVTKALESLGVDSSKISTIEGQIQTAIQSAKSSADGEGNPRAAIQKAIASVLKNYGIDSTQFKNALQAQKATGGRHRHHRGAIQPSPVQTIPSAGAPKVAPSSAVQGTLVDTIQ